MGRAGEQVTGVVIEPVQDLDVSAVGEAPMCEIGLPGLVGLGGFKANVGRARAFLRLRDDESGLV
ncbi:hypothetical protein BHE16_08200 [Neomicrococcus aestuarii]|uniref:Uncharacterized protein n=1 Tax=Neomicrococcus aestuarii TaxID=556325 RepID=A0A1L2ZPN5_9MICC|nr:hypothetical protein BHE16_08200 [Neomicrococcus aestuarii]